MGAIVFKNKDYQLLTLYLAPSHILSTFILTVIQLLAYLYWIKILLKMYQIATQPKQKQKQKTSNKNERQ